MKTRPRTARLPYKFFEKFKCFQALVIFFSDSAGLIAFSFEGFVFIQTFV